MSLRNFQIGKSGSFSASHHLPEHEGQCANDHGHTWDVSVEIQTIQTDEDVAMHGGILVDYGDLQEAWLRYDHDNLNKYLPNPTAELVAVAILDTIFQLVEYEGWEGAWGITVTVQESRDSYARVGETRKLGQ